MIIYLSHLNVTYFLCTYICVTEPFAPFTLTINCWCVILQFADINLDEIKSPFCRIIIKICECNNCFIKCCKFGKKRKELTKNEINLTVTIQSDKNETQRTKNTPMSQYGQYGDELEIPSTIPTLRYCPSSGKSATADTNCSDVDGDSLPPISTQITPKSSEIEIVTKTTNLENRA